MRYISALKNSVHYHRSVRRIAVAVVLPPVVIFLAAIAMTGSLDRLLAVAPGEVPFLLIGLFLLSIVGIGIYRWSVNRQMELVVEADEKGVRKLAPGKPVEVLWADVVRVREVKVGRYPPFLSMKTAKGVFRFDPYLVEDSPDAPQVKQILGISHWIWNDGRTVQLDLESSAGYAIVQQFRPDLLAAPKPNTTTR